MKKFALHCIGILFAAGSIYSEARAQQHNGINDTTRVVQGSHSGGQYNSNSRDQALQNQPGLPNVGSEYVSPPQLPSPSTVISDSSVEFGAAEQPLALPDLIALAQANNPTLKQAQLQITGEMGKAIQAGLYPNPTLRYSAEQIGVEGTPGEFHGGILSQEIVRGGKLRLSRAKYLQRVKSAEALAVAQQYRVCNDVKIHFYETLALQRQVAVQQELVKAAEDSAVTAREAYNMGQANIAETRRTNVAVKRAKLQSLETSNALAQSRRSLAAMVGVDISRSNLIGDLETTPFNIDFKSLLINLLENSPEILAARAKLQSDRLTIEREIAEPIPNLHLEGGAGYNFETDETVAVAGVGIKLPIFDRNQGTIQQAQADYARQCAEIKRVENRLQQGLASEYERYLTATQHVSEYQQSILPELKETYRLFLQSYKENRIDWNEVLHAQNDYYSSQVEYNDWLARMRVSEVLINGMLLHGGLMAAEGTTPSGHIDAVAKPR